jgi:glycine dehydrogenase subunit 1
VNLLKSSYIPITEKQQKEMLDTIGAASCEDLFSAIPDSLRLKEDLKLPGSLSEYEIRKYMKALTRRNYDTVRNTCFLGAGIYDHIIPSAIRHIISRQEFYTSYTPYQPEISQGVLQSIFEYQTMIAGLTGMDAANASMYDGATALYEAVLLACRYTSKNEVLVARSVNPEYRKVLRSIFKYSGIQIKEIGFYQPEGLSKEGAEKDMEEMGKTGKEINTITGIKTGEKAYKKAGIKSGTINKEELFDSISDKTAAIVIQSPNFFGITENLRDISENKAKALLIAVCDPVSLGVFESPGAQGADIAVGEAQPLGIPMNFGGPLLGYFAVKKPYIRRMPGRIVGETTDSKGRRGFVLTLQAREQHIRRERATSNICTNQALCALSAAVYLSLSGKQGIYNVATQCINKSYYALKTLLETGKVSEVFNAPFFREFVIRPEKSPKEINKILLSQNIIGGYDLSEEYPELDGCWLLAVTEKRTKEEIDLLAHKVYEI